MEKKIVNDIYKIAEKYGYNVTRLEEYNDGDLMVRFNKLGSEKKVQRDTICEQRSN